MRFVETGLAGACLVELEKREDERGFFARQYCEREFAAHGLPSRFVQVNNSFSARKHTLRGLHYQRPPHGETKLVRCVRGSLLDVIIDLREDAETYMRHHAVTLSAANRTMLCVPQGFAHGCLTLEDDTEAYYFVDSFYAPGAEGGVRWNDPAFGIDWPAKPAVISAKDASWPDYKA